MMSKHNLLERFSLTNSLPTSWFICLLYTPQNITSDQYFRPPPKQTLLAPRKKQPNTRQNWSCWGKIRSEMLPWSPQGGSGEGKRRWLLQVGSTHLEIFQLGLCPCSLLGWKKIKDAVPESPLRLLCWFRLGLVNVCSAPCFVQILPAPTSKPSTFPVCHFPV